MKKVYEAKGKDSCRMKMNFCGVPVTVNFVNGTILNGKNAQFITENKFIQDAIENDPRFGGFIVCTAVYGNEPKAEPVKQDASKALKPIRTIKNMNDAVDWFASKGEGFSSKEELDDLCEKYGVCFPNLK